MNNSKMADEYVKILTSKNNKLEKRDILMRAIFENQTNFLIFCKEKWGNEYYSEIVADC